MNTHSFFSSLFSIVHDPAEIRKILYGSGSLLVIFILQALISNWRCSRYQRRQQKIKVAVDGILSKVTDAGTLEGLEEKGSEFITPLLSVKGKNGRTCVAWIRLLMNKISASSVTASASVDICHLPTISRQQLRFIRDLADQFLSQKWKALIQVCPKQPLFS
jgi:hypothetical protein